jgi:Ni/Co efflux regulator RcnB
MQQGSITMRATKTISAVLAATLAAGSFSAFAQSREDRRDAREARRELREDRREFRQERREFRQEQRQAQRQWNHATRSYVPPAVVYQQNRYAYPNYSTYSAPRYWSRGDRLPYDWRSRYYVVNNWQSYNGLYAPPAGYGWVQSDTGQYLLVALATGLIANLLLNR